MVERRKKMLAKGDLIRVPANTCLTQRQSELHMIDKYQYTHKPTVGIFIKYEGYKTAKVFLNERYWTVDLSSISFFGAANVS
jgi:hypothetical protein